MNRLITLTILLIVTGCLQSKQAADAEQITNGDSLTTTTLGQQEQAAWNFYQQLETIIRADKAVQEEKINEYIQSLIDKGSIPKPEIFIDTETGTVSKVVDYKTYKKFREQNPINLGRPYVISLPTVDTIFKDSIRKGLINDLKVDSLD